SVESPHTVGSTGDSIRSQLVAIVAPEEDGEIVDRPGIKVARARLIGPHGHSRGIGIGPLPGRGYHHGLAIHIKRTLKWRTATRHIDERADLHHVGPTVVVERAGDTHLGIATTIELHSPIAIAADVDTVFRCVDHEILAGAVAQLALVWPCPERD